MRTLRFVRNARLDATPRSTHAAKPSRTAKVVIKRVMPRQNEEVNEIWLCDKGRFAYHYTESKKRLEQPLVKGTTNWNVPHGKTPSRNGKKISGEKESLLSWQAVV